MTYEYVTSSAEETIELGRLIGEQLRGGDIIAYKGSMGAGKTTMTRGLTLGMGLGDMAFSPTFALVNEYRGRELTLYHFDMYRITSAADLETTGFFDYMSDDSVIAVEWSENIEEELPEGHLVINLERVSDDIRKITIDGDERFAHLRDRYKR
ncbi:MAG: tRNA (adenosine(37)-N6)-threonylcarbamoyltransferase complex ATPase subunit type 1 TsaE [Ruminococcus sp.]|nr:tRNA (adenosine(37)-N6)-threonylcarbamoyltransferase complex ATPase subunit type 1 TsaE [Ruminococcus sp.]